MGLAGLVLPIAVLVAIVGAGLAGPKPEPVAPERSPEAVAERPSASATAATGSPVPVTTPSGPGAGFPASAADLTVLSVPEARQVLAAGAGLPIAVAGSLDGLRTAPECEAASGDTRGLLSPLCERRARLALANDGVTASGAHLHVRFPPGVRLPAAFEDATPDTPMPVVIVGRGEDRGSPCAVSERGCGEQMTADLVAWADGSEFDPGPVFDAGLAVPPPEIAYRHLDTARRLVTGLSGTVLIRAVIRPATVARIDRAAAAALAKRPEPEGLVWYVRTLQTAYGPGRYPAGDYPPRILWVLLDETSGEPIGTGVLTPRDDIMASAPRRDASG